MKKGEWTFLTNHARVFTFVARYPKSTAREIAREAGITLRGVQKIISDLDVTGYIARQREGRCNRYTIHAELPMRHRMDRDYAVGDVLQGLGWERQRAVNGNCSIVSKEGSSDGQRAKKACAEPARITTG